LLELALHQEDSPLTLREIAANQHLSLSYLEHLVAPLSRGGFVRTVTGPRGGVFLNKPPEEIKLSEVVKYLEGDIAAVDCVKDPGVCQQAKSCATRDIWTELTEVMIEFLDSVTLADLVERYKKKTRTEIEMYNI